MTQKCIVLDKRIDEKMESCFCMGSCAKGRQFNNPSKITKLIIYVSFLQLWLWVHAISIFCGGGFQSWCNSSLYSAPKDSTREVVWNEVVFRAPSTPFFIWPWCHETTNVRFTWWWEFESLHFWFIWYLISAHIHHFQSKKS